MEEQEAIIDSGNNDSQNDIKIHLAAVLPPPHLFHNISDNTLQFSNIYIY